MQRDACGKAVHGSGCQHAVGTFGKSGGSGYSAARNGYKAFGLTAPGDTGIIGVGRENGCDDVGGVKARGESSLAEVQRYTGRFNRIRHAHMAYGLDIVDGGGGDIAFARSNCGNNAV